jgi:hypothetical protein
MEYEELTLAIALRKLLGSYVCTGASMPGCKTKWLACMRLVDRIIWLGVGGDPRRSHGAALTFNAQRPPLAWRPCRPVAPPISHFTRRPLQPPGTVRPARAGHVSSSGWSSFTGCDWHPSTELLRATKKSCRTGNTVLLNLNTCSEHERLPFEHGWQQDGSNVPGIAGDARRAPRAARTGHPRDTCTRARFSTCGVL